MILVEVRAFEAPQELLGYLPIASDRESKVTFLTPTNTTVILPVIRIGELPADSDDPVRWCLVLLATSDAIKHVRTIPEFLETGLMGTEEINPSAQVVGEHVMRNLVMPLFKSLTVDMDELDLLSFWSSVAASMAGAMACSVGLEHANTIADAVRPMMADVVARIHRTAH